MKKQDGITRRHWLWQTAALATGGCGRTHEEVVRRILKYAPSPADNPMKGFLPFAADRREIFPHSMEWAYFPLSAIMTGPGRFDFERVFDATLIEIAGRGHQTALRVYLDYPQRPTGVPQFLIDNGVQLIPYRDHGGGLSPDYRNDELIQALVNFVTAFGKRYDGDPRIGYVTLGLLGFWGEWHTYPREELMAGESVQRKILAAFSDAFPRTPLLMRYPVRDAMDWPVGLHDDSFAHTTIGEESWEMTARIRAAEAEDLWKSQPFGGEVRPEVQAYLWKEASERPVDLEYQDYDECLRQTRASWMINEHVFSKRLPEPEYARAIEGARRLGYELHLPAVEMPAVLVAGQPAEVTIELENRGIAPLYASWGVELVVTSPAGNELGAAPFSSTLDTIMPGDPAVRWVGKVNLPKSLPAEGCSLQLRPPRPFAGARPLRFANVESRAADGVVELGRYDRAGILVQS